MSKISPNGYCVTAVEIAELENVIQSANDSANGWQDVCDTLARCAGGVGVALVARDATRRGHGVVSSERLKPVAQAYVEEGWYKNDLRELSLPALERRGYCMDSDIDGIETLLKLPYYATFLARFDLGGFCGLHFQIEGVDWIASIQFGATRFEPRAGFVEHIDDIRGWLTLAATRRMAQAREHWRALRQSYHAMGSVLVPMDAFGQTVSWLLDEELSPENNVDPAKGWRGALGDDSILSQVVDRRTHDWLSGRGDLPPSVVLTEVEGATLSCSHLRAPDLVNFFAFGVSGFLAFSRVEPAGDAATHFATRIGLTPAETRVIQGLTLGQDIKEIAGNLELAEGTVRQYLKSVFRKSDTNSQHQLVAKVYLNFVHTT